MDHEVIVAGAGPVGLLLACELRLAGVEVLVLERDAHPESPLKAGAMGARSINGPSALAFYRRGLLPAVREAALWWYSAADQPPEGFHSGGDSDADDSDSDDLPFVGHFAGIGLRADRLNPDDSDFADQGPGGGAGVISMLDLERILTERATALGVAIRRGVTVTGLAEHDAGVTVTVGSGEQLRTRWLVGCDGGRSTVRKLAEIPFPGLEAEFVGRQAMVEFADPDLIPLGDWISNDRGSYVHAPVPGRIHTVEYDPSTVDRDAPVTAAEMQASLCRISGIDITITAVHAATRYTDVTRQAQTYRSGRVLLAGDAAHVHSPAGGQGLNLGLGDAVNLGWKLAAVVQDRAPAGLLDSYSTERHPIGAWVQGWSSAQTALSRRDPRSAALRGVITELLDTVDGATYVAKQLSGMWQRYDLPGDHPLAGRTAPDLPLADGSRVADHLRAGRPLLLDLADDAALRNFATDWDPTLEVLDTATAEPTKLAAVLIRPDGYVAWAADGTAELDTAARLWAPWLARRRTDQSCSG